MHSTVDQVCDAWSGQRRGVVVKNSFLVPAGKVALQFLQIVMASVGALGRSTATSERSSITPWSRPTEKMRKVARL